jgi:hypothetical protein
VSDRPSKSKARGEKHYLPQIGETPLRLPRGLGGTSAAPAGTFVAPAGTSSENLATGGSAPASGSNSTAAPSAHGDGDTGSHLSEVVRSPSLSSSSSNDEFSSTGGGESPCYLRSRYSSLCCSPELLLHASHPLLLPLLRGVAGGPSPRRRWV